MARSSGRAVSKQSQEPMTVVSELHYWRATGTREQLLQAEIITPAHFPTGRKRTAWGIDECGHDWSVESVPGSGGRWEVIIRRTKDEIDEIKKRDQAIASRKYRLERLAASSAQQRQKLLEAAELLPLHMVIERAEGASIFASGYTLSEAAVHELKALAARMQLILSNAPISFDQAKHAAIVAELSGCGDSAATPIKLRTSLRLVWRGKGLTEGLLDPKQKAIATQIQCP